MLKEFHKQAKQRFCVTSGYIKLSYNVHRARLDTRGVATHTGHVLEMSDTRRTVGTLQSLPASRREIGPSCMHQPSGLIGQCNITNASVCILSYFGFSGMPLAAALECTCVSVSLSCHAQSGVNSRRGSQCSEVDNIKRVVFKYLTVSSADRFGK